VKRAVLDANVIASGVLRYHHASSTPAVLLRRWLAGDFALLISRPLAREVERTLTDPYFVTRADPLDAAFILVSLGTKATPVSITTAVYGIATHPEDDVVLSTAISAQVEYLVTGDKQLLRLGNYRGVAIVSPRAFLTLLEAEEVSEHEQRAAEPLDDGTECQDETEVGGEGEAPPEPTIESRGA
jgi:putative PIN family toxin of toxin-antitoxin system